MEVYTPEFKYRFKIITKLIDEGVEILFNQNGLIAHRRKDISKQDEKSYGLHKALKECNINTKQQIKDYKTLFGSELDVIKVDLHEYLKGAPTVKRISKERLKIYEDLLKNIFKKGYRLEWIIKNGYVLNVLCKDSVPEFLKSSDLNDYFGKCMKSEKFGFVDYENGIILLDNVNISAIRINKIITVKNGTSGRCGDCVSYILEDIPDVEPNTKTFYTDNCGRLLVRSSVDNTYRRYIQLNKPNMKIDRWRNKGSDGIFRCCLYCNDGTKLWINKVSQKVNFTVPTLLKTKYENIARMIAITKKITVENLNKKIEKMPGVQTKINTENC